MTEYKQTTLEQDKAVVETVSRGGVKITVSRLRELYFGEGLTVSDLAEKLDLSQTSVLRLMDDAGIERRGQEEAARLRAEKRKRTKEYADPKRMRELHHEERLTITEIAAKLEVSTNTISTWLEKHGIEKWSANNRYSIPKWELSCSTSTGYEGYPVWRGCDGDTIPVHTLAVIADGADPHKAFSKEYNVDHLNRHPCDSRPENLELVTRSEHGKREARRNREYSSEFTEADIQSVIRYMLNPAPLLKQD